MFIYWPTGLAMSACMYLYMLNSQIGIEIIRYLLANSIITIFIESISSVSPTLGLFGGAQFYAPTALLLTALAVGFAAASVACTLFNYGIRVLSNRICHFHRK